METPVIVRRRFPTYELVIATSLDPNRSAAVLEGVLATGTSLRDPFAPMITGRVSGSAGGSNVHLRMSVRPFWWCVAVLSAVPYLLTAQWSQWALLFLGLSVVILAAVVRSVMRAKRRTVAAFAAETKG